MVDGSNQNFFDYMNTRHPNIRFIFEIEDQNSFLFLDIKIIRNTEEKAFETSVYRKSSFNGVFTNFKILFLRHIKLGYYFSIFQYAHLWKVSRGIKEIFERNSCPEKLIDRCIKTFFTKFHVSKVVELTAAKK